MKYFTLPAFLLAIFVLSNIGCNSSQENTLIEPPLDQRSVNGPNGEVEEPEIPSNTG